MWIPDRDAPHRHTKEGQHAHQIWAVMIGTQDAKKVLRDLYLFVIGTMTKGLVPESVRVNTNGVDGYGVTVLPHHVYWADQAGVLSTQHSDTHHDMGLTRYSKTFYWCDLDMAKLYEFLGDDSLPAPGTTIPKPAT